jgi:hypothetical protein
MSRAGVFFLGVTMVMAVTSAPPSDDNTGVTELIHLCISPCGTILAFVYVGLHLASFVVAQFQGAFWMIFAGFALASVFNLLKLIGNLVSLTIWVENQFRFPMAYGVIASFLVSVGMYLYGLSKGVKSGIAALEISLGYAAVAIPGIASATILFGDPILLKPIDITLFLTGSVLQLGSVTLLDFGFWPGRVDKVILTYPWEEFTVV